MKKYLVHVETDIDVSNAEQIINYVDQGWTLHGLGTYHSYMVRATTTFEVKTDAIGMYVEALKSCPGFNVLSYEEFNAK